MKIDDEILECVDQGLDILGQNVKQFIYFHLAKMKPRVPFRDIVLKPESLTTGLEDMFGIGAKVLEDSMIKEIKAHFDLSLEQCKDLRTAIIEARRKATETR